MFRALPSSSSGGLRRNCIYAASGIVTVCRWLSCAPVKKGKETRFCCHALFLHVKIKENGTVAPIHTMNGTVAPIHTMNGTVAPIHTMNGTVAPIHTMNAYIFVVEVCHHSFLTSALDAGEWSASRPGLFTPRNEKGGWVGCRPGLDVVGNTKISCPCLDVNPRSSSP
jgi:hypothetical protein